MAKRVSRKEKATEESRTVSGIKVNALHFDNDAKSRGEEIALSHMKGLRMIKGGCEYEEAAMVADKHDNSLFVPGRKGVAVNARRNMHLPQRSVSTLVNLKLSTEYQYLRNARIGALCHYYNRGIESRSYQSCLIACVPHLFLTQEPTKKETRNKGGVVACICALIRITRQTDQYVRTASKKALTPSQG